uniref:Sorcin n=1 Tax=Paramormyrops kingsleyae TaxID=1676925 RepID=A0A3B3SUI0_9TELE
MSYPGYGGAPGGFAGGYGGAPGAPGFGGFPGQPQDPMMGYFSAVAGQDGQISADELQVCLTQANFSGAYKPFNLETCRLMISMLDRDGSHTMGFNEFKELWNVLYAWKQHFASIDRDQSGSVDPQEMQQAVSSMGMFNWTKSTESLWQCFPIQSSGTHGRSMFLLPTRLSVGPRGPDWEALLYVMSCAWDRSCLIILPLLSLLFQLSWLFVPVRLQNVSGFSLPSCL